MVTKKEIHELLSLKGECRGVVFDIDSTYVIKNYAKEGINKVEKKLNSWGVKLKYDKIQSLKEYPIGYRALSLLAIKETFKLKDDDIVRIGDLGPKFSIIIKSFLRLLVSVESALKQTQNAWIKNYNIGELKPIYYNKKEHKMILSLNMKLHPIFCLYFKGYIKRIIQMLLPNENIKIKETKCMFKGDESNEYTATY